jgi:hypothetical protein
MGEAGRRCMKKTLVAYYSRSGTTEKMAAYIAEGVRFSGKEAVVTSMVPGMENHPVLKGISPDLFTSPGSLYKNRPLRSETAQVLLLGTIPGKPSEPILWINNTGKNTVIYTSLGDKVDWENESFRQIMKNSVSFLLNLYLKE